MPVAYPSITRKELLDAILDVRDHGETNMWDLQAVAELARVYGHPEASEWLYDRKNQKAYAEFLGRSDPTCLPEKT